MSQKTSKKRVVSKAGRGSAEPAAGVGRREGLGILLLAASIFLFLCLGSYDPRDPSFNVATARLSSSNLCGLVGSHIADALAQVLGIGALIVPVGLLIMALRSFFPGRRGLRWTEIGSVILMAAAISALLERFLPGQVFKFPVEHPGGALGSLIHGSAISLLGSGGEIVLTAALILICTLHISRLSVQGTMRFVSSSWTAGKGWFANAVESLHAAGSDNNWAEVEGSYSEPDVLPCHAGDHDETPATERVSTAPSFEQEDYHAGQLEIPSWEKLSWLPEENSDEAVDNPHSSVAQAPPIVVRKPSSSKGSEFRGRANGTSSRMSARLSESARDTVSQEALEKAIEEYLAQELSRKQRVAKSRSSKIAQKPAANERGAIEVTKRADEKPSRSKGAKTRCTTEDDFRLPSSDLLDKPQHSNRSIDRNLLESNAGVLGRKLSDLGIKGEVVAIHPGPVVTMYELSLARGVPLRKVLNKADDLAMALKSGSTRVVAPIPGKDTVGIEVPNLNRETVYFREIVESRAFMESTEPLKIALGKGIDGEPVATSLASMPHLLIAGATGTGKSVGLNCMICSWLMSCHPDDVKFIMVDPKRLELSYYQDIPHLIYPVVTDPETVPKVLSWAIKEMERRYELLSNAGAKNIEGYNEKVRSGVITPDPEGPPVEKIPYIVIVVDELAELMMVAAKDIEILIARLAQMARAAGIHLILATQRPSVDVITGVIKANLPARLSFQVSARPDSRTILDTVGAENLLGKGDLLFLPPGTAKIARLHGAFVSEDEITRVVDFIKKQRSPVYLEEISKHVTDEGATSSGADLIDDVKYDEAVELVTRLGHASISLIQRHMRIGYNRAARIIEAMEGERIIGPSDGTSRPREVLARSLDSIPDTPGA